jgi:hypothetical protein
MGRSSWTIEEHIKDHVNQLTMIFQKHDLEKHGIILKCLFFFFFWEIQSHVKLDHLYKFPYMPTWSIQRILISISYQFTHLISFLVLVFSHSLISFLVLRCPSHGHNNQPFVIALVNISYTLDSERNFQDDSGNAYESRKICNSIARIGKDENCVRITFVRIHSTSTQNDHKFAPSYLSY